jgi:hypothetical protein
MSVILQNSRECLVCGAADCDCSCRQTDQCACGWSYCPAWGRLLGLVILLMAKAGSFLEAAGDGLMHRLVNKTMNAAIENLLGVSEEAREDPNFCIYMPSYRLRMAAWIGNLTAVKWLTEKENQSVWPLQHLQECNKSLCKSTGECTKFLEKIICEEMERDFDPPCCSPYIYSKNTSRSIRKWEFLSGR